MSPAKPKDRAERGENPSPGAAPPPMNIQETRPNFFLRTKLLPPRPAPELLSRTRLTDRLLANLSHPLTLVTANAGSGKTTLVADFLRTHQRQFVWYQLDHTDADPSMFLGYLAFGIRQQVPDFGEAFFSYLQEGAGELAQHPERAVDVFLNEVLDRVEQQLILVLDDYHHLGQETAVHAVVDRLLAYLPDVLHVIIVSREAPPLALGRLRTQSPLANVGREDLLFTDSETQELFRKVFDLELTGEQLAEYRERTHGWITALQLVRQVAHRQVISRREAQAELPDLVEVLRQSERDIFDYFAEEVFADETADIRKLLLQVSLLDRVELDACTALYAGSNCSRVLPNLVRRNVFITVASDARGEEYRLHPLFQNFLRRRLRSEIGRSGVAAEHQRCAEYFLGRASWEQAVRHLLAAEDFTGAARLIAERGADWISSGALGSLASLADSLPPATVEANPRALAHRAEVARLRGEYDSAHSMLRRAAALLHEQDDREGEADTLHSLATLARRSGDFKLAFAHLDRAAELSEANSAIRTKCGNTRGLCLVAMGEWTAAEREFRAALQSAEERNDEHYIRLITHNLGTPAGMRGDFGEALRWLGRMLRTDRPNAPRAPMPQEAVAHLNIARCHIYRGDFVAGEKHLDGALELCQTFNLVVARAETLETYGNLYREQGEIERAVDYYERAARAYDEAGIVLNRTDLLEERALLSLRVGDFNSAQAQIDRLLSARPREKDESIFFTASLTRGRIMTARGEFGRAHDELGQALEYFHAHGLYYYEAQASAVMALCALHLGKEPEMLERLRRAVDLAARFDYEYWLKQQVSGHPELWSTEEALELLPMDLREQVVAVPAVVEPAVVAELELTTKQVTDLTVNMLGPVEIVRDPSRPLRSDAWPTRRARDIFCFIVSRRHRRASKDTIIDTFWGETDFEAVEKNFHPTVSHIRKALNSNQPLKQNFLLYRDGDYQLNSEFSCRIDTEEFDRLVNEGETARRARRLEESTRAFENALQLYRGEFMQGSYEPWVEEQRSYYREQYLHLLEALAGGAQAAADWPRVMQLAQLIIRDDPFREDIHCLIMRAQAAVGNRGAVKEQFETLKRVLDSELGVEPSAETRKLYQQLIG